MMTEVTIKVPKEMGDIVAETSQALYIEAMKEVMAKRFLSTQKRLQNLKAQIAKYEAKYHQAYEEFAQQVPDTLEGHDDWIEWTYHEKLVQALTEKIEKLRLLLGL